MEFERSILTVGKVLEALFATGLVCLSEHDDNDSRVIGRLLGKHTIELRSRSVLGTLCSNVAARA